VGDEGMKFLVGLGNLEHLALSSTSVTDRGLEVLRTIPKLKTLKLYDTRVGDDGMDHVATLVNLEELGLTGTDVTDRGARKLAGLKKLRVLKLPQGVLDPRPSPGG